jgi:hypothetical protein
MSREEKFTVLVEINQSGDVRLGAEKKLERPCGRGRRQSVESIGIPAGLTELEIKPCWIGKPLLLLVLLLLQERRLGRRKKGEDGSG